MNAFTVSFSFFFIAELLFEHFRTSENTSFMTLYEKKTEYFQSAFVQIFFLIITQHNIYLNSNIRLYL